MTAPLAQIARELDEARNAWYGSVRGADTPLVTIFTEVLTRHWPAARGGVLTEPDVADALRVASDDYGQPAYTDVLTRCLNARARAVSAPVVVTRPVRTVTKLRTPEEGEYMVKFDGEWGDTTCNYVAGPLASSRITAIRKYNRHDGSTGSLIERTEVQEPAPWTAGDVPDVGLRDVAVIIDNKWGVWPNVNAAPLDFARALNDRGVTHFHILPYAEAPDARP